MRVVKITALLNFLNILYDVVIFAKPQWQDSMPNWIGFLQTLISIAGSILFGLSTTIAALYGSKTLGIDGLMHPDLPSTGPAQAQEITSPRLMRSGSTFSGVEQRSREPIGILISPTNRNRMERVPQNSLSLGTHRRQSIAFVINEPAPQVPVVESGGCCQDVGGCSILYQLYARWEQTQSKEKALRVNQVMEAVILPHVSPLYESVYAFRESIRSHMLSRMGLSGILNLMATIFFYYNALIYAILYSGPTVLKIEPGSARLLYLMLNIVNPIVCLAISYVVVLCDNFNSLVVYARKVGGLLDVSIDELEKTRQTIRSFTEKIERPLVRQLWAED